MSHIFRGSVLEQPEDENWKTAIEMEIGSRNNQSGLVGS